MDKVTLMTVSVGTRSWNYKRPINMNKNTAWKIINLQEELNINIYV